MAKYGPIPKRADRRLGHHKVDPNAITKADGAAVVEVPPSDPDWHEAATRWYLSLTESAQVQYYEPSDWATAYLTAESISRDLKPQFVGFKATGRRESEPEYAVVPIKGASLAAYLKVMTDLLAADGARRRAGVELQRPQAPEVGNAVDYRARSQARTTGKLHLRPDSPEPA